MSNDQSKGPLDQGLQGNQDNPGGFQDKQNIGGPDLIGTNPTTNTGGFPVGQTSSNAFDSKSMGTSAGTVGTGSETQTGIGAGSDTNTGGAFGSSIGANTDASSG